MRMNKLQHALLPQSFNEKEERFGACVHLEGIIFVCHCQFSKLVCFLSANNNPSPHVFSSFSSSFFLLCFLFPSRNGFEPTSTRAASSARGPASAASGALLQNLLNALKSAIAFFFFFCFPFFLFPVSFFLFFFFFFVCVCVCVFLATYRRRNGCGLLDGRCQTLFRCTTG